MVVRPYWRPFPNKALTFSALLVSHAAACPSLGDVLTVCGVCVCAVAVCCLYFIHDALYHPRWYTNQYAHVKSRYRPSSLQTNFSGGCKEELPSTKWAN